MATLEVPMSRKHMATMELARQTGATLRVTDTIGDGGHDRVRFEITPAPPKLRVYYAHCKALYGTPQEARDIAMLESIGLDVLNPSEPQYDDGWKHQGMDYAEELVLSCDVFAFRALPQGWDIPAGVYTEIGIAREHGLPVIELPTAVLSRGLDLAQTREYLREAGER